MSTDKLVLSGDYYIKTPTAGTITFDTGVTTGTVVITGNLTVLGETVQISTITNVSQNNLQISDNTIVLNSGETSSVSGGNVSLGSAGIVIDRGGAHTNGKPDATKSAELLWDDQIGWEVPGKTIKGIWTFKRGGGYSAVDVGAIRLNSVV